MINHLPTSNPGSFSGNHGLHDAKTESYNVLLETAIHRTASDDVTVT